MTLPQNAYTRALAREAGRHMSLAWHGRWSRIERPGEEPSEWTPTLFASIDRARHCHELAMRWRHVPWCPVRAGESADAGGLAIRVLVALAVSYALVPTLMFGLAAGFYAVMWLGAELLHRP